MKAHEGNADVVAILEWHESPRSDLTLVKVVGERIGETVGPVRLAELQAEIQLVCFRPEELRSEIGAGTGEARLLDAILDATLLARVALPTEGTYDLAALAYLCGAPSDWANASARATAAAHIWVALVKALRSKPAIILEEMALLLRPTRHPLRSLILEAARASTRRAFGERARLVDFFPSVETRRLYRPPPREPPVPLDVEATCSLFAPGGPLAKHFNAYEYRPEQVRMVKEVCEAFNDGLVLLVEAGTGTGKSLAYLVPAVLWAVSNEDPVVVSTNTKNLQSQLCCKDLPFLQEAIGGDFRFALIKGRSNYLCVRRFLSLLRAAERELTENECAELLPVLSWLSSTQTGDVAELSGLRGGIESELWARISTQPDECLRTGCRMAANCFVRKARATALQADLVVANHSVVFAEAELESVALPSYRCIVFDEAHNLENVVTEAFTVEVGPWQVPRILNRLFRPQRDGAGRGLLATLLHQLARAGTSINSDAASEISRTVAEAIGSFDALRAAVGTFFNSAALLLCENGQRNDKVRYSAERRPENWPALRESTATVMETAETLIKKLETICAGCNKATGGEGNVEVFAAIREATSEVGVQARRLREFLYALSMVLSADDRNRVYWIQAGARPDEAVFYAAPLDVSELMQSMLFSRVRTAVFASATLTAAGRFDYMRERLGIRGFVSSRTREVSLGTTFDFPRQAMLGVAMFMPEPKNDASAFVAPFCSLATAVLLATQGRALVLFTSHAMLREAYKIIRPALERQGIRVLAQGIDGDRARLLALFTRDTHSVLLGTQSFWEGVDVPGESLSCLILAKLPFRVHTDPIVSARCELLRGKGRNEFYEYMVPDAVIRLNQGFGRLIRTRTDRGVVVVCDPRLMTKNYGEIFRRSLPVQALAFTRLEDLVTAVSAFLSAKESFS